MITRECRRCGYGQAKFTDKARYCIPCMSEYNQELYAARVGKAEPKEGGGFRHVKRRMKPDEQIPTDPFTSAIFGVPPCNVE